MEFYALGLPRTPRRWGEVPLAQRSAEFPSALAPLVEGEDELWAAEGIPGFVVVDEFVLRPPARSSDGGSVASV